MEFGENLKKALESEGWSQARLGAAINSRRQTVNNWITGLSKPDLNTVWEIAQAMDVPVGRLFGEGCRISPREALRELEAAVKLAETVPDLKAELDAARAENEQYQKMLGVTPVPRGSRPAKGFERHNKDMDSNNETG